MDSKLASCFHTSLLHFMRFSFRENPFWWLCAQTGLFSCSIRDWFLMKYKAADRHLQTRWKPKITLPPLQKPFKHTANGSLSSFLHSFWVVIQNAKIAVTFTVWQKKRWGKNLFFYSDSWWSGLPDASAWAQKHRNVSLFVEFEMTTSP